MPVLAVPANAGILLGTLGGAALTGVSLPQLATAIASGLAIYAGAGLTVITVDTGVLGAGKGTGAGLILPPPALIGSITGTFAAAVLAGLSSPQVATGIGLGLSAILGTAIINTVNPTVGVGAGVVTAIPNPGASVPAFVGAFASAGLVGTHSAAMATAVALGLDAALALAKGVVVIAGSPSPYPSVGAGFGTLL
jgi:hypothetical protein